MVNGLEMLASIRVQNQKRNSQKKALTVRKISHNMVVLGWLLWWHEESTPK